MQKSRHYFETYLVIIRLQFNGYISLQKAFKLSRNSFKAISNEPIHHEHAKSVSTHTASF